MVQFWTPMGDLINNLKDEIYLEMWCKFSNNELDPVF